MLTKKLFTLFLCFGTMVFANTPVRHRVVLSQPDAILTPMAVQKGVSSLVIPDFPPLPEDLVSILTDNHVASELISKAKKLIGSRYCAGSSGPHAFDCSGFTSYVFRQMGIELKRSSREQCTQGESVPSVSDLLPGDLVFFGRNGRHGSLVNHVGIVTSVDKEKGTFEFIHSSSSRGVRIDRFPETDYWNSHFLSGRRILGTDSRELFTN